MRAFAVLVLVALLAPAAAGQPDPRPPIGVTVAPFEGPVAPLEELAAAEILLTIDCATVVSAAPGSLAVALRVAGTPPWALATVTPATVPVPSERCVGASTSTVANATLLVSLSAEAPAFALALFHVEALAETPAGAFRGNGSAEVAAGYFGILDASVAESVVLTEPGEATECVLTVTNFGNADTKVLFEATEWPEGWAVLPPPPLVLESRQQGGARTSAEVPVRVEPRADGIYANEVGAITVRVTSAYANDANLAGDDTSVSCLVTVKGLDAPGAALGALLALAAAARGRRWTSR